MALTIIRQHIPPGEPFEFDGLQVKAGPAPSNTIGEGNLVEVFHAAADSWEQAIKDDHTVTIQFGWSPLPLFERRNRAVDPPKEVGVREIKAPFTHHLHEVAIAEHVRGTYHRTPSRIRSWSQWQPLNKFEDRAKVVITPIRPGRGYVHQFKSRNLISGHLNFFHPSIDFTSSSTSV